MEINHMIVECRASSPRLCTVIWESFELVSYIRYSIKEKVIKEKVFSNYADADGFMSGLMKRGIVCSLIYNSN